ncbi:MAG: hypothetical protein HZB13_05460 [Acidobacteria bacterium]|nr:hypothetical protein [Acidobacteriota bacterium]
MRRESFAGPLILILVGVVFLSRNIMPELQLFEMFATYWPVLLILLGAMKLLDRLFLRPGGPADAPGGVGTRPYA